MNVVIKTLGVRSSQDNGNGTKALLLLKDPTELEKTGCGVHSLPAGQGWPHPNGFFLGTHSGTDPLLGFSKQGRASSR